MLVPSSGLITVSVKRTRELDTKHNEIRNVLANHILILMTKQHYGGGGRSTLAHLYDNWEIATGTREKVAERGTIFR